MASETGFKRGEHGGFEWTSKNERHWVNLTPHNDWREWMPGRWREYNWRNFHLLYVHVEEDRYTAGWEFDFVILGLGFHLRYTDQMMFNLTEVADAVREARDNPEGWRELKP